MIIPRHRILSSRYNNLKQHPAPTTTLLPVPSSNIPPILNDNPPPGFQHQQFPPEVTPDIVVEDTFKMAPTPFKQFYILRAEYDGVIATVAYILSTCKNQRQYNNRMFTELKKMCPGLDIADLMIDFEPAVRFVVLHDIFSCLFLHRL